MPRVNEFEAKQLRFLESIDTKLGKLLEKLGDIQAPAPGVQEAAPSIGGLIEVKGVDAPWMQRAFEFDGKSEVDDEAELTAFLGFNPNGDKGGQSWCAGFWLKIFEDIGVDVSGVDLRAISFASFGYDLLADYEIDDLPDGAILVFQPDPDGHFPISHVGAKNGDKLFGGNQGNKAKNSNLAFYLQNAKLVAARCPDGYKLV